MTTVNLKKMKLKRQQMKQNETRIPCRNHPRAEGEGSQAIWGVQDEMSCFGGVGWDV